MDASFSKHAARHILHTAFGSYCPIEEGTIEILDEVTFKAAWERVYGHTEYAWDLWAVPQGGLNGFAIEGIIYINGSSANAGTLVHEMLHNNAASDWLAFAGRAFDEGVTDYMKAHALRLAGVQSPNSYQHEMTIVDAVLKSGITEAELFSAYLLGEASVIIGQHVDRVCIGTWVEILDLLENRNWKEAIMLLTCK